MSVNLTTILAALMTAVLSFVAMRLLVRRWNRRLTESANRSLHLPIPAFLSMDRRRVIDRLLEDEQVRLKIDEQGKATGLSIETLRHKCRRYADEIVPAFNAVFYFRIGYWLARSLLLSLYRVNVRLLDAAAMDAIERDASVVLVMNHRSNMDVLLINYLASRRSALMHAAGEWARMWPLHRFVRMAGNCVADRDAQDVLYKIVFKSFVQMAVQERTSVAIFPEGELPRDGKMQTPKLGLFNYVVTASPARAEKIYLIPVGISYDRIPEEDQLVAQPDAVYRRQGRLRRFSSVVFATFVYVGRVLLPRQAQFGNACASFGCPIRLADWIADRHPGVSTGENRREWVSDLGDEIMRQVAALVPVLPAHILAVLLVLDGRRIWSLEDIREEGARLISRLRDQRAVLCLPDPDQPHLLADALEDFDRRKLLVMDSEGRLMASTDKTPLLNYLANSVSHVLGSP